MDAATAIAAAAEAVGEAAREHKRAASFHRRRAREMKQTLDEFARVCSEHGIAFNLNTESERGHSGRRDQDG